MVQRIKLGIVRILIVLIFQNILISNAAKVSDDGGYEIVVGIKEDEPEPKNVRDYVENIQDSFRALSTGMWKATDETFHIKSVEIVLPSTWNFENAKITLNSYQSADVQISTGHKYPQADNPNLCSLPGSHIELPKSFFDTSNNGPYGTIWKALLNVWARYRWGVWEEHGYPGDQRFPYFYKQRKDEGAQWVATGCSNVPIKGVFQQLNGTPCNATEDSQMNKNCRFIPDRIENKNVKSSLMHFHWIESVTRFCDKASHSKDVPNKQNLFCDYKSVQETIETSADAKMVTKPLDYVPNVILTVTKASSSPPLYVLLDRGYFDGDDFGLVNVATTELVKLFGDKMLPKDTIVALGAFPTDDTNPNVKEIIPFTKLDGREADFAKEIADRQTSHSKYGDFGTSLERAATAIKTFGLSNGGRILILKIGRATDSPSFSYEREVELNLLGENINVYAIEISSPNHQRQNLKNIATKTGGSSVEINSLSNAQSDAAVLVKSVSDSYKATPSPPVKVDTVADLAAGIPKISWRGEIVPGQVYSIPVLKNTDEITFSLVTREKFDVSLITAGIKGSKLANFVRANEYSDAGSENDWTRFVYTGVLDISDIDPESVSFEVQSTSDINGYLFVTATGANLPADIDIVVTTTAPDNAVDLKDVTNKNAPFTIFAQLKQGGKPVTGARVDATVEIVDGSLEKTVISLYDNGVGTEDVMAGDGIYSGVFIPPKDGSFSISISVSKATTTRSLADITVASSISGLLPIDQEFIVPEPPVEIPEALHKNVNYNGFVAFKNRADYKVVIQKVKDLRVILESNPNGLKFSHTVPKVLGKSGNPNVYRYYVASTLELLANLDPSKPLPDGVEMIKDHGDGTVLPGNNLDVNFNVEKNGMYYYAVVSSLGTDSSEVSNIVDISTIYVPDETSTTDVTSTEDSTNPSNEGSTSTEDFTNPSTDSATGSSTEKDDDDKPWIKTTAGIITVVVIVVAFFIAAGIGYWYMRRRRLAREGTQFV